jgi:hypothetical protein
LPISIALPSASLAHFFAGPAELTQGMRCLVDRRAQAGEGRARLFEGPSAGVRLAAGCIALRLARRSARCARPPSLGSSLLRSSPRPPPMSPRTPRTTPGAGNCSRA